MRYFSGFKYSMLSQRTWDQFPAHTWLTIFCNSSFKGSDSTFQAPGIQVKQNTHTYKVKTLKKKLKW